MNLTGKGFFTWIIPNTEVGDISAIANLATQCGYSHVLIKIADGAGAYNLDSQGRDLVAPLVQALHERSILALGWHYVYGYEPVAEADIAIQRINATGVDAYVIDAEAQYKLPGRAAAASTFMARLRQALPIFPMALSSYRYPTYHSTLPWREFLEKVDYNMPQVYWVDAHNPGEQLLRSLREFENLDAPFRPMIPTGSAYKQGAWQPSVAEIYEFLDMARNLNLAAANFWEWAHCRLYLPAIWEAICAYPWPPQADGKDIVERYIEALNSSSVPAILALYHPNAVLVTSDRTRQGAPAITEWFQAFLNNVLPGATFSLTSSTGRLGSRQFTWSATSSRGQATGTDSFGLVNGLITYHYTSYQFS